MIAIREVIFHALKRKLKLVFGDSLILMRGMQMFSIKIASGLSENCHFEIFNMKFGIYPLGFFHSSGTSILSLQCSKLHLTLKHIDLKNKQKSRQSLEKYVIQTFGKLIATILFKSMNLDLNNAFISVNGFKFSFTQLKMFYRRDNNNLDFHFLLNECIFNLNIPSLRIPSVEFNLSATVDVIPHLMKNILNFAISLNSLNMQYEKAKIHVFPISCTFHAKNDEFAVGTIKFEPIDIFVPLFDLLTTNLSFTAEEIFLSNQRIKANRINLIRMNRNVLSIPSFLMKGTNITLGKIDCTVSTPMMIDVGLLARFCIEKLTLKPRDDIHDKFALFREITATSPSGILKFELSDTHVHKFALTKIDFKDMVVSAKNVVGDIIFVNQIVPFCIGNKISMRIEPPRMDVKAGYIELILSDDFAETTYFQELFGIFRFLQSHFRGGTWNTRTQLPPTRFIFSLELASGLVRYTRPQLTIEIQKANEAMAAAQEDLRLRQEKALQIIQSTNPNKFNREKFDYESKQLFLKLYKGLLKEIDNHVETDWFTVEIKNLECGINGFSIPNRKAALDKIKNICNEVTDDIIGQISGAPYYGSCEYLAWKIPEFGVVYSGSNLESKGHFFSAYHNSTKANEFFLFKISCDEGQEEFQIPMISSRNVVFLDVSLQASKIYGHWGLAFIQWCQDFKLASRIFRQRHYKFKWLQFIDHTRFRTRWKFDLKSKDISYGFNDPVDPFGEPLYILTYHNCSISFDGDKYSLTGSDFVIYFTNQSGQHAFCTLFQPRAKIRWGTHNANMPKDERRPIFIPIDSSMMTDPDYDPYEKWRTDKFSIHVTETFSDQFGIVDLDQLQIVLDRVAPRMTLEKFVKPPLFVIRFVPFPLYGFTDANITLPPLLMRMMNGSLIFNIVDDPLQVFYNESLPRSMSITSNDLTLICTYNMRTILSMNMKGLQVERNKGIMQVNMKENITKLNLDQLFQLKRIPLKLHPKKGISNLQSMNSVEELFHYFNQTIMTVSVQKIDFRINYSNEQILSILISLLIIEKRINEANLAMMTYAFTECLIRAPPNINLVSLKEPQLCTAMASNRAIIASTINAVDLSISQEDIEFYKPIIKRIRQYFTHLDFNNTTEDENAKDMEKPKIEFMILLTLECLNVELLKQTRNPLITAKLQGICFDAKRIEDMSEAIKISFRKIEAERNDAIDVFHNIFKSNEGSQPIFNFVLNQTRPLMRCPVFDRIDVTLAPFLISIDIAFFMEIVEFFKSTDEMHVLEFDEEEIESTQPVELQKVDTQQNDSNLFFCRMFRFNPIDASLNIRFPRESVFAEFTNRPFVFNGLFLEDIFGTKQQIIALLKKNLKWTVIKALPKLIFKKSKE
ncbi:hypothetical protein TVAG_406670 [Trichomonas vaginalis G3]|uniref:Uncharacterized protein n=1 Tax=Trichomonas vaginalis (strain ATCC PRA-98 / G3) TaxID=412133 RepID=A2EXE1_TRIV3|nr:hypothetical protein TVAGG3_0676910 [Trichomonas vaginalis G3]EAY02690.1 hypothetical protein TVAG_406670 [Trichomonas vaginalis G3]KAI5507599.1 hypothetical protein TVAGG3_0676910 [Trichomonas vaginalis G3]|eukprot:XP_001314913.1 hypothetical protein [Trichomonas vaginalis G3]